MLLEGHPADWFGLGGGTSVQVINSDFPAVTAEADKILFVEAPAPWISMSRPSRAIRQTDLPQRLLRYNALLNIRYGVPIHLVVKTKHFINKKLADRLLKGIEAMEDSVTYQAILEKGQFVGRLQEARSTLIRQGTQKFQAPSEAIQQRIEAIDDLERLEQLLDRVLDAMAWDDLLADR
ncbi:MAG: hypothetical protein IRY99_04435 [Isosphaeraceae bacterium]|nr:hypothetical protein [Isosphaeraceae bacterium]